MTLNQTGLLCSGGANERIWGLSGTLAYDFNTNTWKEMAPGPSGHLGGRLAYDAESDRVILFGGYNVKDRKYLNDTWSYDFNSDTWREMKPSIRPSGRNYHGMAYDAESDRVIIWGGDIEDGDASVWAYDYNKNTWRKMAFSGGPSLRDYITLVYNAKADRIILYGGSNSDESWAYDYNANRWTNLTSKTAGIPSRYKYAMAYSTAADRIILFGGVKSEKVRLVDETWIYDFKANTWTNVTLHP